MPTPTFPPPQNAPGPSYGVFERPFDVLLFDRGECAVLELNGIRHWLPWSRVAPVVAGCIGQGLTVSGWQ